MSSKKHKVFMDFTIGSRAAGRVVFELFGDITPKTAENFRALCTGEFGTTNVGSRNKQVKLHYLGNQIHRIVDGFMIQGGDIANGDGTGGANIYNQPQFADENFQRRHSHAGLLAMANCGRDTNSSQFYITLKECPHLDGMHVVFGQVVQGMEIIRELAKVPTDYKDKPKIPIHIFDCGEVEKKLSQRQDPLQNSIQEFKKLREQKQKEKQQAQDQKRAVDNGALDQQRKGDEEEEEEKQPTKQELIDSLKMKGTSNLEAQKRAQLMLQVNEAVKLNNKAVIDEQQRKQDPNYEQRMNRKEYFAQESAKTKHLKDIGLPKEKGYLFESAVQAEKNQKKKKKSKNAVASYGWDVFNDDSLYRAYNKRIKKIGDKNNTETTTEQDRVDNMAQEIEQRIEKRSQFSRRRDFIDDKDRSYINERNRHFNEKIERNYSKYAAEIKDNLERGTAL